MVESIAVESAVSMVSLAGTVLASSLLGSAHCAGMCGGVALVAIGADGNSRIARQIGYHAGRLVSYAVVGAACGLIGIAIDDAGTLVGFQRVAAVAAGITIALFGFITILRTFGVRVPKAGVPSPLIAVAQRVHVRAMKLSPAWRGVPLGLATPLLPCGWLYAFAAISAGSASMAMGAVVMIAFWLGTVPALVVASNGARLAFAKLGRLTPVIAGLAMMAVGVHAAVWRSSVAEDAMQGLAMVRVVREGSAPAACADLAAEAADLANELPPCCRAHAESSATAGTVVPEATFGGAR